MGLCLSVVACAFLYHFCFCGFCVIVLFEILDLLLLDMLVWSRMLLVRPAIYLLLRVLQLVGRVDRD